MINGVIKNEYVVNVSVKSIGISEDKRVITNVKTAVIPMYLAL